MSAPAQFLTDEQLYVVHKARKLNEVDSKYDKTSEPYKSKYESRKLVTDLYNEILEMHENNATTEFECKIVLAALDLYIGKIYIETEELSVGEQRLKKCLDLVEEHRLKKESCNIVIEVWNQQAMVKAERGESEDALCLLLESEKLHKEFKHLVGSAPYMPYEVLNNEEKESDPGYIERKRDEYFEDAYTHTLYYIAQVYGNLENSPKSAEYCHETLRRQLKSMRYESVDWAVNAATLSQYYFVNSQFHMSRHCLASAYVILLEEGDPETKVKDISNEESNSSHDCEKLPRAWACLYRCFIKYGIALMEQSRDELLKESNDLDDHNNDKVTPNIEADKKSPELYFDLELTRIEEKITSKYLLVFDEARKVFLCVQEWIHFAKEYYTIDEHCSDFIELTQDHSILYKLLSFFEMDFQRQCQMHKKRIDLLESLNKELNPQYFLMVNRQLIYEMAETYSTMLDLKLAIIDESNIPPTNHSRSKINKLSHGGIEKYTAYLDTLLTSDKKMPEVIPEEDERPALVAWFCMGRLYSKILETDARNRIQNTQQSLDYYTKLVDYCKKNESGMRKMKLEYEVCEEMIQLLPGRIRQLNAQLLES